MSKAISKVFKKTSILILAVSSALMLAICVLLYAESDAHCPHQMVADNNHFISTRSEALYQKINQWLNGAPVNNHIKAFPLANKHNSDAA